MDNNRIQAVYDSQSHRIAGRLMKDVDLFEGIKEVCRHYDLHAAQFQCLGSLKHATYVQVIRGDTEGSVKYSEKKAFNLGSRNFIWNWFCGAWGRRRT